MLFRREFLLKHQVEYALTRHEDVIFLQKVLYLAKDIQCINKPMFLYRNNPYSETHRPQSPDTLYVPLLQSWMTLLRWAEDSFSMDIELITSIKNSICVYAMEGIEAMYRYGMSDIEITKIVKSKYPTEILCEYQCVMYASHYKELLQEYTGDHKRFLKREQKECAKWALASAIREIPGIKALYYRKKYPELIERNQYDV